MTDFVVVIPARYASERLPGKPLRLIAGRPMLEHVWHRAGESSARQVVIATDDERIEKVAQAFGASVCMTASAHASGTERIAEVAAAREWPDDTIIVNLQGDEPLMPAALIDQCARLLDEPAADLGTLASPLESDDDRDDPNVVKVVVDAAGFALYFSRASIPFSRSRDSDRLAVETALHHHGIYAYRAGILRRLVALPPAAIERCERLEQLRALFAGFRIRVGIPDQRPGPGVDTERDLKRAERLIIPPAG